MIYSIVDLGYNTFYLEKKTDEENIIVGWAVIKITKNGAEYSDSSKIKKTFVGFADMMIAFDKCAVKKDEYSEDDTDFEFDNWDDFTKKFYEMTFEKIDSISIDEITKTEDEIKKLENEIYNLKQYEEFYKLLSKTW